MTTISKIASCLLLAAVIPSAFAMPAPEEAGAINVAEPDVVAEPVVVAEPGFGTLACGCQHNRDDGRWDDDADPAGRLTDLCARGGGCHQARIGRMCVNGDLGGCSCAIDTARELQHWDGNWWLRSVITCGRLTVSIT